eukprot:TRINITY_DN37753_c0_g1_i1.p2 TRINITY_DN37753_c0_g1~~TRINITY_DN37753_c0_g1_i1.p2  ORF type:complete len:116 (+),score=22.56 TRINITY_DN37753_c0_g1_i1:67-414(+)
MTVYVLFFFFFKQKTAYEMLRSLVGSEMCIRDSMPRAHTHPVVQGVDIPLTVHSPAPLEFPLERERWGGGPQVSSSLIGHSTDSVGSRHHPKSLEVHPHPTIRHILRDTQLGTTG